MTPRTLLLALLTALSLAASPARAGAYDPYAFLIGEWNVSAGGGAPFAVARFTWGPHHSYIWHSLSMLGAAGEETHLEGLLVWNGVHQNLDMLFVMDEAHGGPIQERGTLSVGPDGALVRDITASYSPGAAPMGGAPAGAAGSTETFRETYRADGADRITSAALHQTAQGWQPTFPGSDGLVLTRRTATHAASARTGR